MKRLVYLGSHFWDKRITGVAFLDTSDLSKRILRLRKAVSILHLADISDDIKEVLIEANNNDGVTDKESILNKYSETVGIISSKKEGDIEIQILADKGSKSNVLRIINNNEIGDYNIGYNGHKTLVYGYPEKIPVIDNLDIIKVHKFEVCLEVCNNFLIVPRLSTRELIIAPDIEYLLLLDKALISVKDLVIHSKVKDVFLTNNALDKHGIKELWVSYDTDLTLLSHFFRGLVLERSTEDSGYNNEADVIDNLATVGIRVNYI